ncbi:MAG: divergent polysaccharide deacetylase family protein, partial [Opitutaceae bacterium]|nr:divergent polysaccharide deacetylase family protein [Opitutaceae bacterium]
VKDLPKSGALSAAPIKALLEKVKGLPRPLPKIDKRGRKSWQAYARPLTGNEKGQHVGLMIIGLGLSRASTMAAIRKLPPAVSLVFDPYAKDLDDWLLRARLAGHEVFVSLPMESSKFPKQDPGPMALTTTVQVADNMKRLHSVLSSFGGYVGVVSTMGSKFSIADGQLKPILEEIKKRGLMYVDAASTSRSSAPTIAAEIDLPVVKNNVVLDDPPAASSIQRRLRRLETFVSKNATAIALARPYPVSIHQLQAWTKTLAEKKLVLVPVSSIVGKQFIE